jgi:hypothetical protein
MRWTARRLGRTVAAASIVAALGAPATASADEVATCVKASEQGQQLRDDGKYKRAREQFQICTRDVCPSIVRKDCTEWLGALDQSMPSIVISAKDGSGRDLSDVKVTVDGQPFLDKLDGKPASLDPGEHTIRYESPGAPPADERVVMHAGEKNRQITVRLGAPPPAPAPAPPPPVPIPESPAKASGGIPTAAIVVGAIGVVGIASFAFFGLTGKSDVSDLRTNCAPNCEQSKVDAARSKLIVADISLGVGVVALGVATWMILSNSKAPAQVTTGFHRLDVRPLPGGGVAEIGARF